VLLISGYWWGSCCSSPVIGGVRVAHLRLLVGSVLLIFLSFCVVLFDLFVFGLCLVLDVVSVSGFVHFRLPIRFSLIDYLLLSDLFFQFC
jgi:hypothetical protein